MNGKLLAFVAAAACMSWSALAVMPTALDATLLATGSLHQVSSSPSTVHHPMVVGTTDSPAPGVMGGADMGGHMMVDNDNDDDHGVGGFVGDGDFDDAGGAGADAGGDDHDAGGEGGRGD